MDVVSGADQIEPTRSRPSPTPPSARSERGLNTARRARQASTVIIVVATVTGLASIVGNWIFAYDNDDSNFGSPGTSGRFKFAQFAQNTAYSIGFLLIAIAVAFMLRVQADRLESEVEREALAESAPQAADVLTVDFSHPAPPVLPRQSSLDDSVWRPPDSGSAENPFSRT